MGSRRRRRHRPRPAFTLAELLVVLGIVLIVLALVVPAVGKARGSARKVECLSNVRQLVVASLAYATDNRNYLPDAGSGNAPAFAPLSPRTHVKPPWTPLGPEAYVLPSIGGVLRKYLGEDHQRYWRCPSAPTDGSVNAFRFEGNDPYSGTSFGDWFWPNYSYMAGKEWFSQVSSSFGDQYRFKDWVSRNVSGLGVARITGAQPAPSVVVFYERQSTYHSRKNSNIYFEKGDYYATFGYLDGHAEGKYYSDADGFIGGLHRPVYQKWFGKEFREALPEPYEKAGM